MSFQSQRWDHNLPITPSLPREYSSRSQLTHATTAVTPPLRRGSSSRSHVARPDFLTRASSNESQVAPDDTRHRLARPVEVAAPINEIHIPVNLIQRSRLQAANDWYVPRHMERLRPGASGSTNGLEDFDITQLALAQAAAVNAMLNRSSSVTVGTLGRSRATEYDTRTNTYIIAGERTAFRKTSLPHEWKDPAFSRTGQSHVSRQASVPLGGDATRLRGTRPQPSRTTSDSSRNRFTLSPIPESSGDRIFRQRSLQTTGVARQGSTRVGRASGWQWSARPSQDMNGDATALGIQGIQHSRRQTLIERTVSITQNAMQRSAFIAQDAIDTVREVVRRSSLYQSLERAQVRSLELQRTKAGMRTFELGMYLLYICLVYFLLIGVPLWNGAVWWLWWVVDHKFVVAGTWAVTIGLAIFYAYAPLFLLFEREPPMPGVMTDDMEKVDPERTPGPGPGFEPGIKSGIKPGVESGARSCALIIPCYKSAKLIAATLDAATKVFPPSSIFVIANGNSPTPLDNTEEVCRPYRVNHVWSPVGSKIVAQFVGCYAAADFKDVLLIDDDCALPPNFPIVTDRMGGNILTYGYTIKSVGPNSSRGTLAQQAQDLEYKLSGIQRAFAGNIGSATFPHGAIALWDRAFLVKTFYHHPGFSVSEDWFFGHVSRQLGSRCKMCTSVFIETETPDALFFSSGGDRGGFGEMTIFKQRFKRWNFFFVSGIYYNLWYILFNWKLGIWELGAKIFVFQEIAETLLYLTAPFFLPIAFAVRPAFTAYLFAGTFGMYYLNTVIFNEVHLRLRNERVPWLCAYVYYPFYKAVLTGVNVLSCYWAIWKYAKYFAKRHPKIVEDEGAINVVLKLEESKSENQTGVEGRRMSIVAIGVQGETTVQSDGPDGLRSRKMTVTSMGPQLGGDTAALTSAGQPSSVAVEMDSGQRFSFSVDETTEARDFAAAPPGQVDDSGLRSPARVASVDSSMRHGTSRSNSSRHTSRRTSNVENRFIAVEEGSPDFDALMDRLAQVEARLNRQRSGRTVPAAAVVENVVSEEMEQSLWNDDRDDGSGSFEDLVKTDTAKTDDSMSMV